MAKTAKSEVSFKQVCAFCEKKEFMPMLERGEGIGTVMDNLMMLLGSDDDDYEPTSGVQIVEDEDGIFLTYDNSAREYGKGYMKIRYCPMCGRKLERED